MSLGGDGKLAYRGAIDDDRRLAGKPTVNYAEQALAELTAGKPVSLPATEPYGCSVKYRESSRSRHPAGRRLTAEAGPPPAARRRE